MEGEGVRLMEYQITRQADAAMSPPYLMHKVSHFVPGNDMMGMDTTPGNEVCDMDDISPENPSDKTAMAHLDAIETNQQARRLFADNDTKDMTLADPCGNSNRYMPHRRLVPSPPFTDLSHKNGTSNPHKRLFSNGTPSPPPCLSAIPTKETHFSSVLGDRSLPAPTPLKTARLVSPRPAPTSSSQVSPDSQRFGHLSRPLSFNGVGGDGDAMIHSPTPTRHTATPDQTLGIRQFQSLSTGGATAASSAFNRRRSPSPPFVLHSAARSSSTSKCELSVNGAGLGMGRGFVRQPSFTFGRNLPGGGSVSPALSEDSIAMSRSAPLSNDQDSELALPRPLMFPSLQQCTAADSSSGPLNMSTGSGAPTPAKPIKARRSRLRRQNTLVDTKMLHAVHTSAGALHCTEGVTDADFSFVSGFAILGRIGEGSFSDVFKVRWQRDGQLYAVKRAKRALRSRREREMHLREVKIFQRIVASADDGEVQDLYRVSDLSPSDTSSNGSSSHTGSLEGGGGGGGGGRPPAPMLCKAMRRHSQSFDCIAGERVGRSPAPHIVQYFRAWQEDGLFYTQAELCVGGDLTSFMQTFHQPHNLPPQSQQSLVPLGLLPAEVVWCFAGDIASGLAFIHARGIVHMAQFPPLPQLPPLSAFTQPASPAPPAQQLLGGNDGMPPTFPSLPSMTQRTSLAQPHRSNSISAPLVENAHSPFSTPREQYAQGGLRGGFDRSTSFHELQHATVNMSMNESSLNGNGHIHRQQLAAMHQEKLHDWIQNSGQTVVTRKSILHPKQQQQQVQQQKKQQQQQQQQALMTELTNLVRALLLEQPHMRPTAAAVYQHQLVSSLRMNTSAFDATRTFIRARMNLDKEAEPPSADTAGFGLGRSRTASYDHSIGDNSSAVVGAGANSSKVARPTLSRPALVAPAVGDMAGLTTPTDDTYMITPKNCI